MKKTVLLIGAFTACYLLLPTQSSTIDAWGYAAYIRHGTHLFLPHHLFYNAFGYLLLKITRIVHYNPDTLSFMKLVNAICGGMILFIVAKIVRLSGVEEARIQGVVVFVGATFGLARFATENENYILPIFLSLLGTYYFLQLLQSENTLFPSKKLLFLTSFWAVVACLFHQIHVWWWIGLAVGVFCRCLYPYKRQREFLLGHIQTPYFPKFYLFFLLPTLLIPLAYMGVLYAYFDKNPFDFSLLWHFVFEDFYTGNVNNSLSRQHFLLTPINFVRSFVQIHGNMFYLVRHNLMWAIPAIVRSLLS